MPAIKKKSVDEDQTFEAEMSGRRLAQLGAGLIHSDTAQGGAVP